MLEKFRNEFIVALQEVGFSSCETNKVLKALDLILPEYNISEVEKLPVPWETKTLEVVKMYLASCRASGFSEGTLKNKFFLLMNFFKMVQKPIDYVDTLDVRKFLCAWQNERKVTNRTLDKYRQTLNAFFIWCVEEDVILSNPCKKVKAIKYEKRKRKALTQFDLERLRNSCKNPREKAIIEFMYSTGCRIAELTNLKLEDIDWNRKKVKIFGKGQKERESYLNARAELALKEYLDLRGENGCEYVFCSIRRVNGKFHKVSTGNLRALIERVACNANLTGVVPHKIRHTTATHALRNGMRIEKIQKLLGHSSINTTMIYAEVEDVELQNDHSKCII